MREKDGISESELNALFKERVGRKCILFSRIRVQSSVGKDEIKVQAAARRKKMAISVERQNESIRPSVGQGYRAGEIYPGYQKD